MAEVADGMRVTRLVEVVIARRAIQLLVVVEGSGAALAVLELHDGIAEELLGLTEVVVSIGVVGEQRRGRRIDKREVTSCWRWYGKGVGKETGWEKRDKRVK